MYVDETVKELLTKIEEERNIEYISFTENSKMLFERIIFKLLESNPNIEDKSVVFEIGSYNR